MQIKKNLTILNQQKSALFLLALLFVVSPFYSVNNIGGIGLALTFNIPIWVIASCFIAAGIALFSSSRKWVYPSLWLYLLAFPVIVILIGFLNEVNRPTTWLMRQLYLLGGLGFLFALFQFRFKQQNLDNILFIIIVATGLHGLLGSLQTLSLDEVTKWFPNRDLLPRGNFQQVNVLSSFLVTGIAVTLYYISRPSFLTRAITVKTVIVISFMLAVYVVMASGSRVGLLSLFLVVPLILVSRYKLLIRQKPMLGVLLAASCVSIYLGQTGIQQTMDKTSQLHDESYSAARLSLYAIGAELVIQKPFKGYGIGNFRKAWNPQSSDYVNRNPDIHIPNSINHPHNEILFWLIEGGLLAFAGILVFATGVFIALYRCGFQRGGAYTAMLLPISLHTQVELPFYASSLHWFIWLFLIYLVMGHQIKKVEIRLSKAASISLQILAVIIAISTTAFMVNTAKAQEDLYDFLYNKNAEPPYLQKALNNLYFRPLAEQVAMRSNLYANIENDNIEEVERFVLWANDYVNKDPELKVYEDLISASVYLNPEGKGCDRITEALTMYAHNKPLQKARDEKCS
jgi:O-antigen polymerase